MASNDFNNAVAQFTKELLTNDQGVISINYTDPNNMAWKQSVARQGQQGPGTTFSGPKKYLELAKFMQILLLQKNLNLRSLQVSVDYDNKDDAKAGSSVLRKIGYRDLKPTPKKGRKERELVAWLEEIRLQEEQEKKKREIDPKTAAQDQKANKALVAGLLASGVGGADFLLKGVEAAAGPEKKSPTPNPFSIPTTPKKPRPKGDPLA